MQGAGFIIIITCIIISIIVISVIITTSSFSDLLQCLMVASGMLTLLQALYKRDQRRRNPSLNACVPNKQCEKKEITLFVQMRNRDTDAPKAMEEVHGRAKIWS